MPITLATALRCLDRKAFGDLDYEVMQHAFESQNQLGRLCDEPVYRNDLAARLQASGMPAETEVPVRVSHRDFARFYRLDLVVGNAAIYELKTTSALLGEHEAQLLNYLFLCSSPFGKLVNFRPPKVETRFVNAALTWAERHSFSIGRERWRERDGQDRLLLATLVGLVEDWGTCLELGLYLEAFCFFLGGEERIWQPIQLVREGVNLGNQFLHLLTPETAFRLTALTENQADYEQNLLTLLGASSLRTIQWVNLDRHQIEFITLSK